MRQAASNGVRAAAATTGSSTSRAQHLVGAAGDDPREVGVGAVLGAQPGVGGVARVAAEQLGGERAGGGALAGAGGAVEEVGVRRPRPLRECGAEDGGSVRVGGDGGRQLHRGGC